MFLVRILPTWIIQCWNLIFHPQLPSYGRHLWWSATITTIGTACRKRMTLLSASIYALRSLIKKRERRARGDTSKHQTESTNTIIQALTDMPQGLGSFPPSSLGEMGEGMSARGGRVISGQWFTTALICLSGPKGNTSGQYELCKSAAERLAAFDLIEVADPNTESYQRRKKNAKQLLERKVTRKVESQQLKKKTKQNNDCFSVALH